MEKQVYELTVDPELRDLIPPLTDEERRMLEDSIMRDGCDTPLIVWNGTIVDGHNRYDICREHSIPFAIEERSFADKEAAMFWMLEHQLARRNLNSYQRSELVLRLEPMLKVQAKKNQGTRNDLDPNFRQNSAESSSTGYSSRKMAEMAGVSHDTIKKVKKIKAEADDETKKRLRSGEMSIHRAYSDIIGKEHEGETKVCERCGLEKPYSDFSMPSKYTEFRPICKECEAKAKDAGRAAEHEASLPGPSAITGIAMKDGKTAHISTGLPDDPAMFDHLVDLLKHAQNAYLAAFQSTIAQYHPSMVSEEHNDLIRQLIDYVADTTEELLDKHLEKEDK